jgi:hypothetical protein
VEIKLNKFKKKDINFLFKLRNIKEARKYSSNRKIISKKEHEKWFDQKLKDKQSKIFIIKLAKHKVGYIRLDKKEYWLVSISILKNFRNKTIGKKALSILEKKFNKINIFAKVHYLNKSSIAFFKSCNYDIKNKTKNFYLMKKNKKNNYLKIINSISNIRSKNNLNWMDILKIAFKYSPSETSKVMKNIYYHDKKISELVKKL